MNRRSFGASAAALLTACIAKSVFSAAPPIAEKTPPNYVTIHVADMHCAGCCKKVSSKLYTIKGVIKVQTNLQKHLAVVIPTPGAELSPRKLWEAIEQVKMKPVKLVTAKKIYTEKPHETQTR